MLPVQAHRARSLIVMLQLGLTSVLRGVAIRSGVRTRSACFGGGESDPFGLAAPASPDLAAGLVTPGKLGASRTCAGDLTLHMSATGSSLRKWSC